MAKTKPQKGSQTETMEDRIKFLIKHSKGEDGKGQMPVGMQVNTQEEAAEAKRLLKKNRDPSAKLIEVVLKS